MKNVPPKGAVLAAHRHLGAFLDRVGDVGLDLLDRLHVDQRPDHCTRLEAVGDLHGTVVSASRLVKASWTPSCY